MRYNSYSNNVDMRIQSIGQFLIAKYGMSGNVYQLPNYTMNFFSIQGSSYIVATQTVSMPMSEQQFLLVLFSPRSDFYGTVKIHKKNLIMLYF